MITLEMWNKQVTHITKEEYLDWLKRADIIEAESPTFTSCCGPHEFARLIHVKGMLYELSWGWYPEEDTSPDAKHKYKTTNWWGVKELCMDGGQYGDGV